MPSIAALLLLCFSLFEGFILIGQLSQACAGSSYGCIAVTSNPYRGPDGLFKGAVLE